MQPISPHDVQIRIGRDNPWWFDPNSEIREASKPRRAYFPAFKRRALNFDIRRATILLGARRVGKTFMVKQLISEAIADGFPAQRIMYVSIDTPVYSGIYLEKFVSLLNDGSNERSVVIFDEIQYLKNWEQHLKDLVDSYPSIKFIATGSAAAALKLKSQESGAGRFSDFMLPPLTFSEFLDFLGEGEKYVKLVPIAGDDHGRRNAEILDVVGLNSRFIDYLNYGGYPEAVLNDEIRQDPEQFIKNDIIDKVLLKDLPALYGINNIQELNRLFSFLSYNAGREASYENISQDSGISKPTIKKYIEYLESAFLIIKLPTIDDTGKSLKRERNFKIYLSNPSMRAALFAPVDASNAELIGLLAECAIFSQWQHGNAMADMRYARWKDGEVDIVYLSGEKRPYWIGEIKWSDRIQKEWGKQTKNLCHFLRRHPGIESAFMTTKTIQSKSSLEGVEFSIDPSAAYCYTVGKNLTDNID